MKCSECECLVRVKNKLGYNLYYCGYKKYGVLKALSGLYINNEEYRKNNETCKYYKGEKKGRKEMTAEEKAEKYIKQDGTNGEKVREKIIKEFPNSFIVRNKKSKTRLVELLCEYTRIVYLDGHTEGRKELEKENAELKAENKQIIERERVVPEHYLCEMIEKCKELKAQLEKMTCENKYLVSDDTSNAVPCYTVYDCEHCSKRG